MLFKQYRWPVLVAAFGIFIHHSVQAEEQNELPAIEVRSEVHALIGVADSASDGKVTAKQIEHRPFLRPSEVMETVPGLIVTQHSGDGKANQYFLRGFNLDHGSDFATYVNGMPINMVSHAHGQGYMDLNFLIPELIGGLRYQKGTYAAEDGDFSTTGSARIDYKRSISAPFVDVSVGEYQFKRALVAGSEEWNGLQWLGALELAGYDGPWDQPENLNKINGLVNVSSGTPSNGFSISAMAYRSRWVASEHVPERAIDEGEIRRYGTLLPNDGGETHRVSLSGEWTQTDDLSAWRANAWVIDYGLNLFSSPSGFINGPEGDQHEQADHRTTLGGQLEKRWFLGENWLNSELSLGTQLRHDRISTLGLYDTVDRDRTNTVRQDHVDQTASALYTEVKTHWLPWLRSTVGLRYDYMDVDVSAEKGVFNQNNGGKTSAQQLSPKFGLAIAPWKSLEFYANWGRGFHSNDSRGAVITDNAADGSSADRVPLIAKSTGSELGLRAAPLSGWHTSVALWKVESSSELVFVGDEGVTEPRGSSQRYGIEWTNHLTVSDWVFLDADIALSKARFDQSENGGKRVPNAVPLTASLAANYDDGNQWSGGVRVRYIGSYALEETGQEKSSSFTTANAKVEYKINPQWQASLSVLNLFNRKANDIEYYGGACTKLDGPGCGGGEGIDGRLIHPLEPRSLRVGLRYTFK